MYRLFIDGKSVDFDQLNVALGAIEIALDDEKNHNIQLVRIIECCEFENFDGLKCTNLRCSDRSKLCAEHARLALKKVHDAIKQSSKPSAKRRRKK